VVPRFLSEDLLGARCVVLLSVDGINFFRAPVSVFFVSKSVLENRKYRILPVFCQFFLDHGWEEALVGRVFSKVLFHEDGTLLVANFGVELIFLRRISPHSVGSLFGCPTPCRLIPSM